VFNELSGETHMASSRPGKKTDRGSQQAFKAGDKKSMQGGGPAKQQDAARRLGTFVSAGEASRKGSRTSGIGGQTKQKSRTDRKKK
jgi:hypothetical protein